MARRKLSIRAIARKHGFRSGLEDRTAIQLKESKINYEYETLKISYTKPATEHVYTPDFILQKKRNGDMVVETKGRWVAEDRKKLKLITEQNPDLDLRLLFQNPNQKIRKGSKTTYGDFADKLGLKWAPAPIPEAWLKECK